MPIEFYPIGCSDPKLPVEGTLELIRKAFPDCEINEMSTIIKGDRQRVFDLINSITENADNNEVGYSLNLTISNVCGCTG